MWEFRIPKEEWEKRKCLCARCGRYHEEQDHDLIPNLFHEFKMSFNYLSPFDMTPLNFELCELCLFEIIRTFKHPPLDEYGENIIDVHDKYKRNSLDRDWYRELKELDEK